MLLFDGDCIDRDKQVQISLQHFVDALVFLSPQWFALELSVATMMLQRTIAGHQNCLEIKVADFTFVVLLIAHLIILSA